MALGRARLEQPSRSLIDERPLAAAEVDAELARLNRALMLARGELANLREKLHGMLAGEVGDFIDVHSLILADRELNAGLADLVRVGRYRASAALKMQRDRLGSFFGGMG